MLTALTLTIGLILPQAAVHASPASKQQQPEAAQQKSASAPQSIVPKYELNKTTTYTVTAKGTASGTTTIDAGQSKEITTGGGVPTGEWTCRLQVRALRTDARKDETEIEVTFIAFKGICDDGGADHKTEFDTSKRFVPRPQPRSRPRNGQRDDDHGLYNGIPYDRLIDDYFRKMNGTKVILRVDSRGNILSSKGGEILNTPNVGCTPVSAPHSVLAWLFGPVSLNDDKNATGLVKEGDHWTHTRVFRGNNNPPVEPLTTITQFSTRIATPEAVEIDGDGELQPRSGSQFVMKKTEKSQIKWDPAAGQLVHMSLLIDAQSTHESAKTKGHNESHNEMTIDRVEQAPSSGAKPKTPDHPASR